MRKLAFILAAGAAALILCGVPARGAPAPCLGDDFWAARPFSTGGFAARAMTVGNFNNDAFADLAVVSASNDVSILLGMAGGRFGEAVNITVGQDPVSVATGDLNGDGQADLVTANEWGGSLSVLLGNGAGGFPSVQEIALGLTPTAVALADFNGDGKVDVAVGIKSWEILVFLGTGTGGFMPPQTVALGPGHSPSSLTVDDFNGDGKADLAVAVVSNHTVAVLLGNGGGDFSAAQLFGVGFGPRSVATADLNGDGKADLVTANRDSDNVSVLLGTGTGSFSPATQFAADQPGFVTIADINGDGKPDIATASFASPAGRHGVSVLLGTGTGSFTLRDRLVTDGYPTSLVARDFDADGKVDLAVADYSRVVLLRGLDAGFVTAPIFDAAGSPLAVAVGDLNGDGTPDLVATNSTPNNPAREFVVLLGLGAGHFGKATPVSVWSGFPTAVAVADVNGDGKLDVVTTEVGNTDLSWSADGSASVFLGNGAGGFADPRHFGVGYRPKAVVVADFNGDGHADLAVANSGAAAAMRPGTLSILLGAGTGDFAPATSVIVAGEPYSIVAGDFNGDGHADLATANSSAYTVSVLLGTGSGTFAPATEYAVGALPRSVATGDFNGDGHLDLAVGNLYSNDVSILLGTGTGQFGPAVSFATPDGVYAVAVGDFNGDAHADLAVAQTFHSVSVLLGTGTGAFSPPTEFAGGLETLALAVADLNGDGRPDVAVAGFSSGTISVLLNTADGCPVSGLFVSDVVLIEGNAGTVSASFTVTLAPVNTQTVEVHFETADDSATAPSDYTHVSGLLSYAAGESTRTVTVDVNGDAEDEANETFFVNLSNPAGATLQKAQGQATIVNDDSPISDPALVYRLLHPRIGAYLYTIFPHERDMAVLAYGYVYEGICCLWFLNAAGDGRTPLYRLYSAGAGEYFYTIYPNERDWAVQQYGYVYEGVAAYCHTEIAVAAPLPWYRLRYGNKHLYTIYASERDSAVRQYGYTYEGGACHLPPF